MTKEKKKALMNEIDDLWSNGHEDALKYWGKLSVRWYKAGELIGILLTGIGYVVYRCYKARKK